KVAFPIFSRTLSHKSQYDSCALLSFCKNQRGILMRRFFLFVASLLAFFPAVLRAQSAQFSVSFPKERSTTPLDGRLLVLLSTDPAAEPRNQIGLSYKTQIVFGVDVDQMKPGDTIVVNDKNAFGYPVRYLRDLKPGEYYLQALLHRYETFHRADGHSVKL